jgi:hypothetical protein
MSALKIIGREDWGAAPPKSISRCVDTSTILWVHHSMGAPPPNDLEAECRFTRNIQAFHQGPERGWADFGYAFGVAPSGRVFRGRGPNVYGAHCPGHNDELSICMYGDYTKTSVPEAIRVAIWQIADMHGKTELRGHRQGYPTSCPGDEGMVDVVKLPRPTMPAVDHAVLPWSNTLRMALNGRGWAGWEQMEGPLRWIAKKGLDPKAKVALAWRGTIYREPETVEQVAKTLVNRFLS